MGASKIMVIRHAEKPPDNPPHDIMPYYGVSDLGLQDPESLIVQGWQRAGALTCFFAPTHGPLQNSELATPQFLFASGVGGPSNSKRPQETITPLSLKLNLNINTGYLENNYAAMVTAALACDGVVLICWQHEDILPKQSGDDSIVGELIRQTGSDPKKLGVPKGPWPGDRYDMVFVFDRPSGSGVFTSFTQVPQMLLAGDSPEPIS